MKLPVLIQGFFFQDREWFDLGMGGAGEGVVVVVRQAMCRSLFSGIIYREDGTWGLPVGLMNDVYGESTLSDVFLTEDSLRFVKKYNHRTSTINYEFVRQGNLWVGGYRGETVGGGGAKCLLAEAPATLFQPNVFPA